MIDFNTLETPTSRKQEIDTRVSLMERYIIGGDPWDQDCKEGHNIFVVFDKALGRNIIRVETSKTFDEFVELVKNNNVALKMFKISKKFIDDTGRCKRRDSIGVQPQWIEGDITTLTEL